VGPFVPKKERDDSDEANTKWTNIYVKYLDKSVDDDKLRDMFTPFGKITSAVVMKDEKGDPKGFGFVNFEGNEQASKAIADLNGKEIDGKQLFVGRAQKKSEREKELKEMFFKIQRERMSKYQGVNLYVKNLDDSIDDEKLRTEFSSVGTITSAKVMTDEKKKIVKDLDLYVLQLQKKQQKLLLNLMANFSMENQFMLHWLKEKINVVLNWKLNMHKQEQLELECNNKLKQQA